MGSTACHGSPLPVILINPSPNFVFFSLFVLTISFFSSESPAIFIAFSHAHRLDVTDAIMNNRRTNHTAVETKNRVLLSMKGRVLVYKKESVPRPESEGTGKVTGYQW